VDDANFIQQYNVIRTAKPGAKSALASEQARQSLPVKPEQFMLQFGLSKKQTKDLFFAKGYGKKVDSREVQIRKQTELTQGDMSGIKTDPWVPAEQKWTPQQITETGIKAPQFVKDKNARITSPVDDVESILTAIQFEGGSRNSRITGARKSSMGRIQFSLPKTTIEKDESLVAFDINRVRELARIQGTTAVKKRVSKPKSTRPLRTSIPKPKPKEKKVTSFADVGQLDGDFGINFETGNIDPMTRKSSYRIPSWYRF